MDKPDFSGYATKAGLKCSDGRTIAGDAFAHQDQVKVPLVWQHIHDDPENVLGHVVLEHRDDKHAEGAGVYCYGYFNGSKRGQSTRELVEHGDVVALSIYANGLVEKMKQVLHGAIREVSLVLSGANPGAFIDNVKIAHSDGSSDKLEDEAFIFSGEELRHGDEEDEKPEEEEKPEEPEAQEDDSASSDDVTGADEDEDAVQHADGDRTLKEIYDGLDSEEKDVVHYMIAVAVEDAADGKGDAQHSDTTEGDLTHQEGSEDMGRNVFDGTDDDKKSPSTPTISHSQIQTLFADAEGKYGTLKNSFVAHAAEYGIEDIDFLFPDAKNITTTPEFISRRMEWVAKVLDGARHSPFSRIKSMHADLTEPEARAKGYVKGTLKKEEVIKLLKRVTTPTTVYKKQKLDRDDIVDITDFDVVVWLKGEMRIMLEEELGRAILIGDGREPDDDDKIDEEKIRPIAFDDNMYAHAVTVPSNVSPEDTVEAILRSRKFYKGTGRPTLFTTDDILTDLILIKDKMGRRIYMTEQELAAALRVDSIVVVEVMEDEDNLLGVLVNMSDYTIGADRGGQLAMFDDFDIDYNQQKYLLETRMSGCLTKAKSALVLKRTAGTVITPLVPEFDTETNTITVPTQTGSTYYNVTNPLSEVTLTDGADVVIDETTEIEARPDSGYSFPHNTDNDWTFPYTP